MHAVAIFKIKTLPELHFRRNYPLLPKKTGSPKLVFIKQSILNQVFELQIFRLTRPTADTTKQKAEYTKKSSKNSNTF